MFSGATHAVRRFSLLLLEEGELYVQDFVASCRWPASVVGNWQRLPRLPGTLRLCTKSLFFEPDDVRVPIVRLPFTYVEGLEGAGAQRLVLTASRVVKMRASAADAPYAVERAVPGHHHGGAAAHGSQAAEPATPPAFHFEFELAYASLEGVMPLAQQMLVASRLPPAEQEEFLQATMAQAEAGRRFDLGLLRSPGERISLELPCTLLSQGALVREPGRLLVTDQRLYFQPLHTIGGGAAVHSHALAAVAAAARRRSSLRDLALEVFFAEPAEEQAHLAPAPAWGGASALFAFASREERERAVEALKGQPELGRALPGAREAAAACAAILEADPAWLSRVTEAWQRGLLSNLDYLLFLNLASGRSFTDLSQYPVMPWVLSDYASPALDLSDPAAFRDLSRPVGALNPRRLEMLQERFREMAHFSPEPPFLYGSHYSTPGFTMFWLVRAAPAHMLRLQGGRFDAPDRLFCSVREAWEGVTSSNPADVKELIPEFYLRHDFLVNRRSLALGTRQSGRAVGDVELPAWATGGAPHFQAVLRAALEAPYVSANLHHWIDLIFGCKQRGEASEEADNVFRHTAYEGAVDIDAVADRTERIALETQINEFGQCPRQLFRQKHPQRLVCPPPETPTPEAAAAAAAAAGGAEGGSQAALPLALVATILAAAGHGQGESPRLEVPPLLAQLDALAARRRQEEASAAAAAAAEAEARAAAAEPGLAPSESGNSAVLDAAELSTGVQASGASGSRLRLLGAWAAERKAAVGERLAGGVGAVREAAAAALATPAVSGGSAARLQSLFNRKGSTSSVRSSVADASSQVAAAPGGTSVPQSPAGPAGSGLLPARLPPQSPGGSVAATSQQQAQTQEPPLPPQQPAAADAAATPPAAVWKFARRGGTAQPPAALPGDSSDDEAAGGAEERAQQHASPPDSPQQQEPRAPPVRSAAALLEAQRLRMLRLDDSSSAPTAAMAAGSGGARGWWGRGLRDRLMQGGVLAAGGESVNACALAAAGGGVGLHAYSASHSGVVRVHSVASGEQVRAASLSEQPLASLALLQLGDGGASGGRRHPLVLCGAFDACVHVYSPDFGCQLGSFQAAEDAVACLRVLGSCGVGSATGGGVLRLLAAGWDGSVKLWELAEGRQPWDAGLAAPLAAVAAPSSVWALAAAEDGSLVLAGTEDGLLAAWDFRAPPRPLWQHQLAADSYVGEVQLCPGGTAAVAAAADGRLTLLDLRRPGAAAVAAAVCPSGTPLRCCATDGALALAGDEGGALHLWDVGTQLGAPAAPAAPGAWTQPRPDGLFAQLAASPRSAVNALAVAPAPGGGLALLTAHEGGMLRAWSAA